MVKKIEENQMSKIIRWKKENCYLCKGYGRVHKNGLSRGFQKCRHEWSLSSFEERFETSKEEYIKSKAKYEEMKLYKKNGIIE
jgi:hypothetical protein